MSSAAFNGFPFLLGDGSSGLGQVSLIFLAVGFLLSFILVQFVWRMVKNNGGSVDPEAAGDSMIICPECGNPTEMEYRFCRICAGDTGKGYVDMVEPDDSSQSGMF